MKSRQSGFTLIEIALVMVIIGLLIGGVLKGQALIDNAKIKSVVNDMKGVQTAYYAYFDRMRAYPTADANYTATTANTFWGQVRTQGFLNGDPASLVPGVNAMGGDIGVVNGVASTGITGNAVCTSVLAKYAQGIDAGLDDGISTSGSVKGSLPVAGINHGTLNEAIVSPILTGYGTDGYVVICMQL